VGEANGVKPDDLPKWVGADGVFDMIFEFNHLFDTDPWHESKDWGLKDVKQALSASQQATASNGWYPIFFENHDMPRSIDCYFPEDADGTLAGKALATVLLTLRGTPFIYEGEELGYQNVAWQSIEEYNDLNSKNQYEIALSKGYNEEEALAFVHRSSRDNARTPMQWDDSKNAGFSTGTPWLPVHEDYEVQNAEKEASDPASVLSWYFTLADFRQANEALIDGDYAEIVAQSEKIYAYIRDNGQEELLVAVNFTGEDVPLDLSEAGLSEGMEGEVLLSSYDGIDEADARADALRPYEAIIVKVK
jgi:alpha-glucosidase